MTTLLLALCLLGASQLDPSPRDGSTTPSAPPATAPPDAPNVLIILADDLGVDRLGAYGDSAAHTPVLDALAGKGALFTQAYAESVCSPTRAALLTGTYPHRFGISNAVDHAGTEPEDMLPLDAPSLAQQLPDDYRAEAVGKWHLANKSVGLTHPLLMGFDHHTGTAGNPANVFQFAWTVNGALSSPGGGINGYVLSYTVDRALQRLAAVDDEPFVMYLALHAPHKPLHPVPGALHSYPTPLETDVLMYRAYVEAMDAEIGRLLEAVDFDTTYVIFLGDNGTIPEAIDPELAPEQSKGFVYEGGIHVPWIVVGPGVRPGVRTGLTHVVDVAPTVVELVGGDASVFPDGRSFVDALFEDRAAGRESAYFRRVSEPLGREEDALRSGRWKLVRDIVQGTEQLFDLSVDPGELSDRAAEHPNVVARLRADAEVLRGAAPGVSALSPPPPRSP